MHGCALTHLVPPSFSLCSCISELMLPQLVTVVCVQKIDFCCQSRSEHAAYLPPQQLDLSFPLPHTVHTYWTGQTSPSRLLPLPLPPPPSTTSSSTNTLRLFSTEGNVFFDFASSPLSSTCPLILVPLPRVQPCRRPLHTPADSPPLI
ncbi:hypothetical protein IE81DRAFT_140660 [Ceraceosorus guamensis]|uniref:Uncharacterized protein n=1 Tax=Ceraceosorus guamensis TaxID=1522189 RepID=A0A316W0Z2_9BASI|nr:hypothetical protein IE81DRAFT_140660 [Ceraceosorus guamensis]PWN42221.1 hypothetical protein IE81DRAFT_140660 [Ceraceosorus guamensis]